MNPVTSVILDVGTRSVIHTTLVFSLYLLFAGHNAPGGGFIGGLVAGVALVLWYVAEGAENLERLVRIPSEPVLGVGVLLAAVTGVAAWFYDDAFLASAVLDLHLPAIGEVHIPSVLVFDIGVYLVVVGLVRMVLRTLGEEAEVADTT